ncbi:SGNH/GDSL hydrolase family protein [Verrucomicrobium sp. BvORR106]|uniref:SGNH/GDSL hydrolase family protein n=1 Tax=Verrucomicrobium sp. BvORR106 TaxID=1403819 RepID=UPI00056FB8C4|nr:SGNH/GDSL hydrolase family protein [Verrucomicrobium sp. BvORR106]
MKRRSFITTTLSLSTVPLMAQKGATVISPEGGKSATITSEPVPSSIPPQPAKPAAKPLTWHDAAPYLEGRGWGDEARKRYYDRFPSVAEGKVTDTVWNLSRDSAGMLVRFKSNATNIQVRYKLLKANLAMPHMPATGVSGVDLYAKAEDGKWRWVGVSKPDKQELQADLTGTIKGEAREWMLYLPLFNGVEKLEIGVSEGATFEGLTARPKPVVFYGTSITHGACASRPGMVHTAILGRRLDRHVMNLGFSGNGKMDAAVGDQLVKLDPAVYVIDCNPNMGAELIRERCVPLVKQLRAARPKTPIVLVEDRRNTNSWIHPDRAKYHTDNHVALKEAFDKLKAENVTGLFYLPGDNLLGDDSDGATDGSHPSDLGFFRQADAFEPVLREALKAAE